MNQGDANSQASGGVFQFKKRRRSVRKKKTLTATDVKRIAKSAVRDILEHKHYNKLIEYTTASPTYPLAGAGIITDVSDMAQGVLDTERTGDQVTYTSWTFSVMVNAPDSIAQFPGVFIRVIGFLWRAGSAVSIPDILTTGNASRNEIISSYDHHTKSVRKILFDKTVTLFDRAGDSGGTLLSRMSNNSWVEKFYVNLTTTLKKSDRVLAYDPAAATTGYNKLYVAFLTTIPTQASGWLITGYSTLMYLDG